MALLRHWTEHETAPNECYWAIHLRRGYRLCARHAQQSVLSARQPRGGGAVARPLLRSAPALCAAAAPLTGSREARLECPVDHRIVRVGHLLGYGRSCLDEQADHLQVLAIVRRGPPRGRPRARAALEARWGGVGQDSPRRPGRVGRTQQLGGHGPSRGRGCAPRTPCKAIRSRGAGIRSISRIQPPAHKGSGRTRELSPAPRIRCTRPLSALAAGHCRGASQTSQRPPKSASLHCR